MGKALCAFPPLLARYKAQKYRLAIARLVANQRYRVGLRSNFDDMAIFLLLGLVTELVRRLEILAAPMYISISKVARYLLPYTRYFYWTGLAIVAMKICLFLVFSRSTLSSTSNTDEVGIQCLQPSFHAFTGQLVASLYHAFKSPTRQLNSTASITPR
jgi:hypothetical protein